MKYCSKKMLFSALPHRRAFSLVEAVTALVILGLICSSVLVVINRCVIGAADSELRMRAFEVARENMEKLLASESVGEASEYGESEKYPEIQWDTTVETFYEPLTSRIWIQAICSAQYTDTAGDEQEIELTHWLTEVSKAQLIQMIKDKQAGEEGLSEEEIEQEEAEETEEGEEGAETGQEREQGERERASEEKEAEDRGGLQAEGDGEVISDMELQGMSIEELIEYLHELSSQ